MTHLSPDLMNAIVADRLAEGEYRRRMREHADRIATPGGRRRRRRLPDEL